MKIAYILTLANVYGGAQVHVRDLTSWMKDHGHQPIVLAGCPGIVSDRLQQNDIPFYEIQDMGRDIKLWTDVKAFFQTRKILKDLQPDIISCHSSKAGIIGRLAAKSLGIPVIFTAHGWAFTEGVSERKRSIFAFMEKLCAKISHHIITVSRYDKFLALDKKVVPTSKVTVVHNGMPYQPPFENRPDNDVPQLVKIARFSIPKDHTTLLNALALIKDKSWHLNLVGGGDDQPYKALAKSLDIEDKVTFHGQRTDIHDYLFTQDIFLLISDWEGFPRSIIEAMRASLPVITTRVGGCPESVNQFQSGYIIPKQDAKALSVAISRLVDDPLRRKTMGEVGRHRYDRYFTFDIMAEKTLTIYETVLGLEPSKQPALQVSSALESVKQ